MELGSLVRKRTPVGDASGKMRPRFITAAAEIGDGYSGVNRVFAAQRSYLVKLPG